MAVKECYCGKLSHTKKSIFGLSMSSQILFLLLALLFVTSASAADTNKTCSAVRSTFYKKGYINIALQSDLSSDAGGLCLNEGCCSKSDANTLIQKEQAHLEHLLKNELEKLALMLSSRAARVDDFFRKLLQLSRESFDIMFKRTYGMIYEQHSYIFTDFFDQLERYYTKGDTNFHEMMETFFSILYEKMFAVLNSQYSLDEKYLKCVSSSLRDIEPFEDVPLKLSIQLRRAFVATRIFHKALRAGSEVVNKMMGVGVTAECVKAWTRLTQCGTCAAIENQACSRYCHNVIRGCLPIHMDLSEQWDVYVDAVDKVGDRLLGPFNIAMVVEPIDIKISEAIMSFQEHNLDISKKIFSICGQPTLGSGGGAGPFHTPERSRRSVRSIPDFDWNPKANEVDDFEIEASFESIINEDPSLLGLKSPEGIRKATKRMAEQAKSRERFLQYMKGKINLDEYEEYEEHERKKREANPATPGGGKMSLDYEDYERYGPNIDFPKKPAGKIDEGHGSEWGASALEKLVRDTRFRMHNSRRFWMHLPAVLCAHTSITTSPCFNGSDVGSYTRSPAGEGIEALASNPEVRGKILPNSDEVLRSQNDALTFLIGKLKDAYNGIEVQWQGEDRPQASATSRHDFLDNAGSGSGSGDDGTDDTENIDDEDDYQIPEMGSGESLPEEPVDVEENSPPPAPKFPYVPNVVDGPSTNNVDVVGRNEAGADDGVDDSARAGSRPPVTVTSDSADLPSLHKALFTYALPVVCAWFGTIVTDLF